MEIVAAKQSMVNFLEVQIQIQFVVLELTRSAQLEVLMSRYSVLLKQLQQNAAINFE